jgi:drug/metabolite transporter (DMT)-like permease
MNTLLVAMTSIALSVVAQFFLKAGMTSVQIREALAQPFTLHTFAAILTDKFVMGGFVLYGLGAMVWLGVLSRWDVSKAYPLVGLGFAMTVLLGVAQGEHVTRTRMFGVFLICIGVWIVASS